MAGYFQRVIENGARPVLPVGRSRWQPSLLHPNARLLAPTESTPDPPAPAGQSSRAPSNIAPRQDAAVQITERLAKPQSSAFPSPAPSPELKGTFIVSRRNLPGSTLHESPVPAPMTPARHSDELRPAFQVPFVPLQGSPPVFRVPELLKTPPSAARENSASSPDQTKKQMAPPPAPASNLQQFREVIAWIEEGEATAPPARTAKASPVAAISDAERVQEKAQAREKPLSSPAPQTRLPKIDSPRETNTAPVKATALEIRPAPVRQPLLEKSLPAVAPRSETAAAPKLIVNRLNVQVVNEDRHRKAEKPSPKVQPPPSAPREDWGRFERRYLRLP